MSNAMFFDSVVSFAGTLEYPSSRGIFAVNGLIALERQSVATDPIGSTSVTFQGVAAGSEIRVYSPVGEIAGTETCVANQSLTWPVYSNGSPNNIVQIKIINFAYRIMDFPYTSVTGNQTIPVQMEADRWAYNP